MDANLQVILQQLEAEKSIDRETLIQAIEAAIESAAKKSMTHAANVTVEVDPGTLEFRVFEIRTVVEKIEDPAGEIRLDEAKALNPEATLGDRLKMRTEPKDFGRIAAQTAKQVIIQKIKDAERDNIYDEFKTREGEVIYRSCQAAFSRQRHPIHREGRGDYPGAGAVAAGKLQARRPPPGISVGSREGLPWSAGYSLPNRAGVGAGALRA